MPLVGKPLDALQERVNLYSMSDDVPKVDDAYALSSRAGVKRLYADWAQTYDDGFCAAEGYQLPDVVAQAFIAAGGSGAVLDFGAGTGLLGQSLARLGIDTVDGVDISSHMLEVARGKLIYRSLFCVDVLSPDHGVAGGYNGVVSAGTLTLGHVGPEALAPLLGLAAPGAVFALSINAEHFQKAGFAAAFDELSDAITGLSLQEQRIYDDRAHEDHRNDLAVVATFSRR